MSLLYHVQVCAVDINEEKLQSTVKELKAVYGEGSVIGNKCDVTNASELEGARRLMNFGNISFS